MSKSNLDRQIKKAQKEYGRLISKLKKISERIMNLNFKRYEK